MADSLETSDTMYLLTKGSGPPVLFLHGMPTSSHLWDGVIERMFHQHACIAVDLPGLGRSPRTIHGFRKLDILATAIEKIRVSQNIAKWHVVGHDAGCAIAVHYAHRFQHRVERLALLTPSVFPDLKPFPSIPSVEETYYRGVNGAGNQPLLWGTRDAMGAGGPREPARTIEGVPYAFWWPVGGVALNVSDALGEPRRKYLRQFRSCRGNFSRRR